MSTKKLNKITLNFLTFSLAFGGLVFSPLPVAAEGHAHAIEETSQKTRALGPVAPRIAVAHNLDEPVLLNSKQSPRVLQGCGFVLEPGVLQGSLAANLLIKPASCFVIGPAKRQISQTALSVEIATPVLTKIVVSNVKTKIQNQVSFPSVPDRETSFPLPTGVIAFAALFLVGVKIDIFLESFIKKRNTLRILALKRLLILRC